MEISCYGVLLPLVRGSSCFTARWFKVMGAVGILVSRGVSPASGNEVAKDLLRLSMPGIRVT